MHPTNENIHFVTGRLAEHALRRVLEQLAPVAGFNYSIDVLPITVAALMSPAWVLRHARVPPAATRVLLPGYCEGDLSELAAAIQRPVERGPRDLRELPEYFGRGELASQQLDQFNIEIIAEINHAPRLSRQEILDQAQCLAADGADVIDVGCQPGDPWLEVGDCVRALRDQGYRVSIDSLQSAEIERATKAGAELVLSVNGSNREAARDWGCEVVAIPDSVDLLDSFDETIAYLEKHNVPTRIDPILEPIGCGFAGSLWRYIDVRRRYCDKPMLMGIGNLTEMTDVDSAAINVLLLGLCQELGVRSVLTTQVINWARTTVRECDLARRLVHYAVRHSIPPKHLSTSLLLLRDKKLRPYGADELAELARQIKDGNVRILAENGTLYALRNGQLFEDPDPFALFQQLLSDAPDRMDVTHAFYLGYEMCKASIALNLSKEYEQDESLDWGYLTVAENWHRLSRHT